MKTRRLAVAGLVILAMAAMGTAGCTNASSSGTAGSSSAAASPSPSPATAMDTVLAAVKKLGDTSYKYTLVTGGLSGQGAVDPAGKKVALTLAGVQSGVNITWDMILNPVFRGYLARQGVCYYPELEDCYYNSRFLEMVRAISAAVHSRAAIVPAPSWVALSGLRIAGVFLRDKTLVHRMRSIAFAVFTPFYFIRAGSYVSLPALWPALAIVAGLLFLKMMLHQRAICPLPTVL